MRLISDRVQDLARYRLGLNCAQETSSSKRFGTRVLLRTREPAYLGGEGSSKIIPGSLLGQNLANDYWNTHFQYREPYPPGFSVARWAKMKFGIYATKSREPKIVEVLL